MAQHAEKLIETVKKARVIPVIILDDVELARPAAEALVSGGLNVLEVTLRTPNALKVMAAMAGVPGAVVGSGTVRSAEHMRQSVDAGCQFMVSPGATPRLLEAAEGMAIPLLPGIGSPTEAMVAAEAGYTFLKFFPAEALGGAPVLKAFQSPLPELVFCPTGGISTKNAMDYLSLSNVVCVGGSWVLPADALAARDFGRIETLAGDATQLGR
ncbi:MAG: bifunctional 4-hydroxy-2-oxoglutarate aldolase/2-dehydro-3-deoxy-phosphogluconate aldolase [Hyphomicrobiaceae bacterium]|nr:bifunctional 4-hydroxy-2-oxoglutarate aldolase/2-dehydro-3-deoxy-phosphogluconate aldolase [Hyphomicrobiaceae bacterium]